MRKLLNIAALALAAALLAAPVQAQEGGDGGQGSGQSGAEARIAPSQAVKLAMGAAPGAKPLGVSLRGGIYVVRLRQDGSIIQMGVDPATGDVFPLQ
jgi:hypothetical protein